MKLAFTLFLVALSYSLVSAQDGVYNNTLAIGPITKGKILTKTFTSIPLPVSSFALEAIQVAIVDDTTNSRFNHDLLSVSAVDITVGGKKVVSFTASNILNPLYFPSPYALPISGAVDLTVSLFTTAATTHTLSVQYYLKYSTSANVVSLTRTATSCVANYSSFIVPGTGGVYTVQNPITWQQNIDAMAFQAAASQGVISMQIADSANNVVCKSNAIYRNNILQSMTPCTTIIPLLKGTTYITSATYNNSKPIKGVFGNFGFYVGFPRPTTTGSSASSTHTTSGPAVTSSHSSTTGPATSGPSSSGPSSSGPSTGGHSSSSHTGGSSAGGSSAGGSSAGGSSSEGSTSSNPTSSNPTSSQFTTTADSTSSNPTATSSNPTTASPTVSPTGYTVGTGMASFPGWEPARRIQIY